MLKDAGYTVVGQAGDAVTLLDLVREHRTTSPSSTSGCPRDHSTEGLTAAQAIRAEVPETAILIFSALVEVKHAATS
jgi:serine/threonine-protein kinase PknK